MDPFEELGLSRDASPGEIRAAYRSLASNKHPDGGGDVVEFVRLNTAYKEALKLADQAPCPVCNGKKVLTISKGFHSMTQPCPKCKGTGKAF